MHKKFYLKKYKLESYTQVIFATLSYDHVFFVEHKLSVEIRTHILIPFFLPSRT